MPGRAAFSTDESGAAAAELALVLPMLAMFIFGAWAIGWALYNGDEVRHAVELGSRVYVSNPNATLNDLNTAVSANLVDIPMSSVTLQSASQVVGSANAQHISWSYQMTESLPFLPTLPFTFSGSVDVPLST